MGVGFAIMSSDQHSTIHATAVLVGARAVLILGPPGVGKSRLALAVLAAAQTGQLSFARLVGDDRVLIEPVHGRLLVRPAPALAGLLEVRGLGIRRVPHEPVAVVGAVLELAVGDAGRLPEPASRETQIAKIRLPRLAVAPGVEPLSLLVAFLQTADALT
jgi:HPr kinase/phosphorylase